MALLWSVALLDVVAITIAQRGLDWILQHSRNNSADSSIENEVKMHEASPQKRS